MQFFCTLVNGRNPWAPPGGTDGKISSPLETWCGLGFAALISLPAGRSGSNPGTVYLCAISEHSHHNSQLHISESYNSTRFNAVM